MNKEELNSEIISHLKTQQKEYKYGSDAYNVLRKLETTIPNIVNEQGEGEWISVKERLPKLEKGDKIKLYGKETEVVGFKASWNDALELPQYEIILGNYISIHPN